MFCWSQLFGCAMISTYQDSPCWIDKHHLSGLVEGCRLTPWRYCNLALSHRLVLYVTVTWIVRYKRTWCSCSEVNCAAHCFRQNFDYEPRIKNELNDNVQWNVCLMEIVNLFLYLNRALGVLEYDNLNVTIGYMTNWDYLQGCFVLWHVLAVLVVGELPLAPSLNKSNRNDIIGNIFNIVNIFYLLYIYFVHITTLF